MNYFLASLITAAIQVFLLSIWFSLPLVLKPNTLQQLFLFIPLYIPVLSVLGIIFSVISRVKRERGFPIIAGLLNFSILAMLGYAFLVAIYSGI